MIRIVCDFSKIVLVFIISRMRRFHLIDLIVQGILQCCISIFCRINIFIRTGISEIAGLFHTTVPAVNAAIRAVRKSDVLNDYEVCRYMQLENGLHADVYALEIIIPVAFRVNTYNTHLFRTWLVGKALSQEKRQTYVMFIQNGKAGYC